MTLLMPCSSMAHVIDCAVSFRFCDPPYVCVAVRPDGVLLARDSSPGIHGRRIFVHVARFAHRGDEPVTIP